MRFRLRAGQLTLSLAAPFLFPLEDLPQSPIALPPLLPSEQEIAVLPGVMIEGIPKGSALEKAGLKPGDIVLSWERPPNPPANPQGARGVIETPWDWMWLEIEQAPRGDVVLSVLRSGVAEEVRVPIGTWKARLKPFQSNLHLFGNPASSLEDLGNSTPPASLVHRKGVLAAQARTWSLYRSIADLIRQGVPVEPRHASELLILRTDSQDLSDLKRLLLGQLYYRAGHLAQSLEVLQASPQPAGRPKCWRRA